MSESTIVNPASSSASTAARREAIVPPEPLWLTGLRVFAKCTVLLVLLVVLVQMESNFGGMKIDSKVGGLRNEVGTKIGEKSVFLESQLKESGATNEGLEKLFREVKDMKRMLKEEFEKIHRELRKHEREPNMP